MTLPFPSGLLLALLFGVSLQLRQLRCSYIILLVASCSYIWNWNCIGMYWLPPGDNTFIVSYSDIHHISFFLR